MKFNKMLFGLIRVGISLLIAMIVIGAAMKIASVCYDFGYRVFTEGGMDEEPGKDIEVTIPSGLSDLELGQLLEDEGLVRDAELFMIQMKLSVYGKNDKQILPGTYTLNTSMSAKDMMEIMSSVSEEETEGTEAEETAADTVEDIGQSELEESTEESQ